MSVIVLFSACSIYKTDIEQGNTVNQEQIKLIKTGMTTKQIQQVLGSPLMNHVFNINRWDYLYQLRKADDSIEQTLLTIHFDNAGLVQRVENNGVNSTSIDNVDNNIIITNNSNNSNNTSNTDNNNKSLRDDVLAVNSISKRIISTQTETKIETPTQITQQPEVITKDNPITSMNEEQLSSPDINIILNDVILGWKDAWQSKSISAYALFYDDNYSGELNDHAIWLAQRQRVLEQSGNIDIQLSNINILQTSDSEARATFTQYYRSNRLTQTGTKHLFFKRIDTNSNNHLKQTWKIIGEQFIKNQ